MMQAVTRGIGIQEQLQRLHGRYYRLSAAVKQAAGTVMITNRLKEILAQLMTGKPFRAVVVNRKKPGRSCRAAQAITP